MIISLVLVFLAVILTGISQILLKTGSESRCGNTPSFKAYLNKYTISAYVIFLIVTIISVIALIEVPLKLFSTIASLNFVVVALLSWVFLKEEMNRGMVAGILLIVSGIIVFNL
jgi:drug/metabolite transporter (DMT)-like permease